MLDRDMSINHIQRQESYLGRPLHDKYKALAFLL